MIKIVTLIENSVGDKGLLAEHGLSFYVETKKHKLLVDVGQTELVVENAKKLDIDLSKVDTIFLSHAHYDHTGGIMSVAKLCPNAKIYLNENAQGEILSLKEEGLRYIGIDKEMLNLANLELVEGNLTIDEELSIFTGVTKAEYLSSSNNNFKIKRSEEIENDDFSHEHYLVVKCDESEYLFSGCAHKGIVNILDKYKEIYYSEPDYVIGGFHLMKKSEYTKPEIENIMALGEELRKYKSLYFTGHCTGDEACALLKEKLGHKLVKLHVGDRLQSPRERCERSLVKKFRKELWAKFVKAIKDYELINDGDVIACCISGGKDSFLMAKLFEEIKKHGKKDFEVKYLVMNPGYNQKNYDMIVANALAMGIDIEIFDSVIFDSVKDFDLSSACYLCARMRRGNLYAKAKELGCNKIALGHHYDDVIETILMGMLYGGQIQSMLPKLKSTNFEGMELIRPLYLCREEDIKAWRDYNELKFLQCACRFTEASEARGESEHTSKRAEIKELIKELNKTNPVVAQNIFKSVCNVQLNTIIEYKDNDGRHNFLDNY